MNAPELFEPFPKIPRYSSHGVITEKLDGTNAQILIRKPETGDEPLFGAFRTAMVADKDNVAWDVYAGSRNRLITIGDDNYGFAGWVARHATELVEGLGEGRHFGEWWGPGIQRGYGVAEKRFSLFNVIRWNDQNPNRPACCHVVPTLYSGDLSGGAVEVAMDKLAATGSQASPGFMRPEGVIVWHAKARAYYKKTFEHDRDGKEAAKAAA